MTMRGTTSTDFICAASLGVRLPGISSSPRCVGYAVLGSHLPCADGLGMESDSLAREGIRQRSCCEDSFSVCRLMAAVREGGRISAVDQRLLSAPRLRAHDGLDDVPDHRAPRNFSGHKARINSVTIPYGAEESMNMVFMDGVPGVSRGSEEENPFGLSASVLSQARFGVSTLTLTARGTSNPMSGFFLSPLVCQDVGENFSDVSEIADLHDATTIAHGESYVVPFNRKVFP